MSEYPEYPTGKDIRLILNLDKPGHSFQEIVDHIDRIWHYGDWGFKLKGRRLELHTGGWSGNEDIITTLEKTIFWSVCWQKSFRGGHFYFTLPKWWKQKSEVKKEKK